MADSDRKSKNGRRKFLYVPRFGCYKTETDGEGNFDMEVDRVGEPPSHLVVMVNGIIGSAQDWRFAAKQFLKKFPQDIIVHCSKSNSSFLTFDGVDIMGERLADEVISVISSHSGLQKISFVGHSLGGLVARYAIAMLYKREHMGELSQGNGECNGNTPGDQCPEEKLKSKIAGLEPINFIAIATPHLGSRWNKQVPLFCGFHTLEKAAARASWVLGRTGKQLFLTDSDNGKPPLLLQMVSDSEDLKFMSALQSFRRRVVYANAGFDHLVGWSTSSLRYRNELRKHVRPSRDVKYPHIVNVEAAKTVIAQQELPSDDKVSECKKVDMEEVMLRALTKLSWERIDVSFSGSKQRFLAHSTIQVKHYSIHSDGADVVQHMVDSFLV